MSRENMTTLLIGASGGIGQAVAKQLAAQGHALVLCGRNEMALENLRTGLPNHKTHRVLVVDINHSTGRDQIVSEVASAQISRIINLAGINQLIAFEKQSAESIEATIQTNLTSIMVLTHDLIPILAKMEKSMLINVGSALGAIGIPGYVTYCASKFALRGFCEALSRELSDSTIQIRYFAPRTTQTSINSDKANAMNTELGNRIDSTEYVAKELLRFLETEKESCHPWMAGKAVCQD